MACTPAQLFEPLQLRSLRLRNRSVVSPMCQYTAEDGMATSWHVMHLGQLACSGVGLVIIEATGVEAAGRISPGCLGLYDDRCESALSMALSHCRQHSSAALGIQLAHAGRKASTKPPWGDDAGGAIPPSEPSGWEVVAPDTEPNWRPNSATPTALDEPGMERIIACWVDATERANRVGLDLIEIHCAHGYLLPSFLAGSKRSDDYTGLSIESRAKFPLRVFEAVRAAWPTEKPLGVRFAVGDCGSVEEACSFAEMLASRGCDFVDISGGTAANTSEARTAATQSNAGAIRRHLQLHAPSCSTVVMTVGGIREPQQAEAILQDGEADLIGIGSQFLYEPRWVWRAANELLGNSPEHEALRQDLYPPQFDWPRPKSGEDEETNKEMASSAGVYPHFGGRPSIGSGNRAVPSICLVIAGAIGGAVMSSRIKL